MGSEYIFFDADLRERFVQIVDTHGLACATREDAIEGHVVELAGEPDEEVLAALEKTYEDLLQEQMLRAEDRADWGGHQVVSLRVTLADGGSDLTARLTGPQGSGLVSGLAHAGGLAIVPEDVAEIPTGDDVEVMVIHA